MAARLALRLLQHHHHQGLKYQHPWDKMLSKSRCVKEQTGT